tara:strand:+ start:952 stop:1737 length:786 start_codon:yes stop_codon:yes gene_type:complete
MSWNGTVRCSWCGQSGHNAAGCKEKLAKMKEWRYDDDISKRQRARNYFSRRERKAERAKNRSCSYCGEPGHTKRTCKLRKADVSVYAELIYAGRKKLYKSFQEKGFGPGALVSYEDKKWSGDVHEYVTETYLGVVTSIEHDELSHRINHTRWTCSDSKYVKVSWINHPAGGMKSWPASLPLRAIDIKNQYSDSYKIEEVDWSLTDSARMRIITPLEDPALTYPSMSSCEKLASKMLDESGKERWRMPYDLEEELSKRGVKV